MCALVRVCMPDSALRNRQALHFIVFSGEAVRRGRLKIQHIVNTQLKKAPGMEMPLGDSVKRFRVRKWKHIKTSGTLLLR